MTVFIATVLAQGQCQPIAGSADSQPASAQGLRAEKTTSGMPQFFDEPQFTVAGVTDASTPGGHGVDTVVRTKEALAKDTAALGTQPAVGSTPGNEASEQSLREAAHAPGSFEANYELAKLLVADGKAQEALPYLERAALLDLPNTAGREKADLHRLLADVEEKLNNPLDAVREYQRAAELDPSESNFFDWGAELLMHRAFPPAIEVFTKGNHSFPRSIRMLVGLGVSLYDSGAYDQAAQHLCEASDLNPADPAPYLFMGKIQALELTTPEGIGQRLERFAQLQPENALANYYYAVSVWQRRKGLEDTATPARVESLLVKATHLDPKLAPAYLQLGIVYSERQDWTRAISSYQQAAAADPQLDEAHYRLASAYRQTGETQKAQQELALYDQIRKKTTEQAERERREIREFVYSLRDQSSATPPQAKP